MYITIYNNYISSLASDIYEPYPCCCQMYLHHTPERWDKSESTKQKENNNCVQTAHLKGIFLSLYAFLVHCISTWQFCISTFPAMFVFQISA